MVGGESRKMPRSLRIIQTQERSVVQFASARYSASVEEREHVGYFLDYQVIGLWPKKTIRPVVEQRSIRSPAQSESMKAVSWSGRGLKESPLSKEPWTYLRILLAATRWLSVERCINWQMWFTTKERSRQVNIKYCSPPNHTSKRSRISEGSTII